MFAFFFVLIGGLFMLAKCLEENSLDTKRQDDFDRANNNQHAFFELVNTSHRKYTDLKNKMAYKIYSGWFVDEIYKELHDDLSRIFGNNYREKFPLPGTAETPYSVCTANENRQIVELLLYSKIGRMPPDDLQPDWWRLGHFSAYNIPQINSLIKCVERNLKETVGKNADCPPIRIVQVPYDSTREDWGSIYKTFAFECALRSNEKRRYI